MSEEAVLREKLRKIEALFAGAGTIGERTAAEAAIRRVQARLRKFRAGTKPSKCSFPCATSGRTG